MKTFRNLSILGLCGMLMLSPMSSAQIGNISASRNRTQVLVVDTFTGLWRSPSGEKIPDGAHERFQGVYTNEGNIQVLKGRDRLISTAPVDATVNMLGYYENAAGTTKKLIVKESNDLVTYTIGYGTRTVISASADSLTDEATDWVQVGDTLYITSTTDGLRKWTGSGNEAAIGSVSAPSATDFSASTTAGGMTTGQPILVAASLATDSGAGVRIDANGVCTAVDELLFLTGLDLGGSNVTADSGTLEAAATSVDYKYKTVKYNSLLGIESEPSVSDTATLTGDDTFSWNATRCTACDSLTENGICDDQCCTAIENVSTTGAETATSATSAADPGVPFDSYRYYRSTAGGEDYFLAFESKTFSGTVTDGRPDVTLRDALDTTIDTIAPPSLRYIEEYKGSLFVAENDEVRFSRTPVNHPLVADTDTYWLDTDFIHTGMNKPVTGLKSTGDSLLIFSANQVKEIVGFGAETFRLKNLLNGVGAVADETIESDSNGDIIFFAGTQGVFKLRTFQQPTTDISGEGVESRKFTLIKISGPMLNDVFRGDDGQIDLDPTDYSSSHAYYDLDNDLYFLYIDQHNFIFNNRDDTWSYQPASQFTHSLYRRSGGELGQGVVIDNLGYAFNNWLGYENGIESGTVTGNPTSGTSTTLTDTGATFNTTGDGLTGLWVAKDDSSTVEYRQITSNTATVLTTAAWTTAPATSDTYYIAYIPIEIDTKIYTALGRPPAIVDTRQLWLLYELSTVAQTVDIYSWENKSAIPSNARSKATDSRTGGDLTLNGIIKFSTPMRDEWIQWGFRAWTYNTSNTIDPPFNVISYAWRATEEEPK